MDELKNTETNDLEKKVVEETNSDGAKEGTDDSQNGANKETADQLANRKFAEGAKKKEKEICAMFNVASINDLKALVEGAPKKADYDSLMAKSICSDLDVKKDCKDDLIAIVKGKGLELTEDNIKSVLEKHPEWKVNSNDDRGRSLFIGKTGGKDKPAEPNEKDEARKLFK